jgi:hypothetical protein
MTRTSMTVLQSFPPDICSLICQDPILERLELNSICFILHAFRNEAQRELSSRFPCLRGPSRVKAWCLSLQSRPHLIIKIKGLVLLLPPLAQLALDFLVLLKWALHVCENLKELVVLFQGFHCESESQDPMYFLDSTHWHTLLDGQRFKLTQFVNGNFFIQDSTMFADFLRSQPNLESLDSGIGFE